MKSITQESIRISTLTSLTLTLTLTLGVPGVVCGDEAPEAEAKTKISFYKDIRPIFQAECHGCHQPAKDKGGYVMTDFASLIGVGDSEKVAIVPGKPDESYLVEQITPVNGEAEMPQKGDPLSDVDIEKIRTWIADGAVDDTPAHLTRVYNNENPPEYIRPPVISTMDYSPDGSLLAVGGFHEVLLHRTDGSGLVGRLIGLSAKIASVAFSPDGKFLAVTGGLPARMGEVQIWDVQRQTLRVSAPVSFDTVFGASWSPDGKYVAFGCTDTTVRAINARTGEEVLYQSAHDDWALDTIFSVDGSHLVSVGRDQTAKLIEFETQRFVDNITSITPGALKGGLQAVDRHPERDEILVGGADGAPQIYRMYRETKRVIGDNANLIRIFPNLPGRIFSVAFRPDGKRIVAGSSLDGAGYVGLYSSDYDSTLSDELKGILQKVAGSRSAAENAKVEEYRHKEIEALHQKAFPAGIYAVAYHPELPEIAVTGADGVIRILDAENLELQKAFSPVPLSEAASASTIALRSEPASINLENHFDYNQLLIQAWTASGEVLDVTRKVTFEDPAGLLKINESGRAHAMSNGSGKLIVSYEGVNLEIPVIVSGVGDPLNPDYIKHVNPLMAKMGCNAGTCHGAKDGKNGFKLSLRGYDPVYDLRSLTDDLFARRVNFASVEDSLILLKGTGSVPHEGGQRMKPGSDYYEILKQWIAEGAKYNPEAPRVASIEITPINPVVQKIGDTQQMRIVATYTDGATRDVTREAFIETGNGEVAATNESGLVTTLRRGEAPILARFEGSYAATTVTVMGDRSGFEWTDPEVYNPIDQFAANKWRRMKILPSETCTDLEFIRRVSLDLTGLPPAPESIEAFLADSRDSKTKRAALVDELIGSEDFVEYWTNKWADLLQVNRKFLGVEGSKLFRDWIREQVDENTPYDQFVSNIITARGSNRENPAASYFKILRTPEDTMENTTHLFLATRFSCNKCHDHPFERWTQDQYYQMSAFFSRVGFEKDPVSEDKRIGGTAVEGSKPLYEIVFEKPEGEMIHQRTGQVAAPKFPFMKDYPVDQDANRREALADWMTSPENPYFAKSFVNRVWSYLLGVGLIEPVDDIRAGNPPSNPEMLDWLTDEFINSGFDVRHVMRLIANSRVYQLSVRTNSWNDDDMVNFSHAIPKRLPAEVLFDAIYYTTGAQSNFEGAPQGTRAASLNDVGVTAKDGFLATLGRPARESACECERSNDIQLGSVMALVSGPTVDDAISSPNNIITQLANSDKSDEEIIQALYMRILNRPPSESEKQAALDVFGSILPEHDLLKKILADYQEEIAPREAQRKADWQSGIDQARAVLEARQAEIAEAVAQKEADRLAAIESAENRLNDYELAFGERLAEWRRQQLAGTEWKTMSFKSVQSELAGVEFATESDGSIFVSGAEGKNVYELVQELGAGEITGLRLETLVDERLPKNGPGRADDGNYVLTELEVLWAPASDPENFQPIKIDLAKADYSQGNYDVTTAIDGKLDEQNNGWAVSPKLGENHIAVFELAEALKISEPGKLKIRMIQKYTGNKFSIGRFRWSSSGQERPLNLGAPANIVEIAMMEESAWSDDQRKALLGYFRANDIGWKQRIDTLAEARKPVPEDSQVMELKQALAKAEEPLTEDPQLRDLNRALELSSQQIENRRLTAAQDLAWALINNPAFLFNY